MTIENRGLNYSHRLGGGEAEPKASPSRTNLNLSSDVTRTLTTILNATAYNSALMNRTIQILNINPTPVPTPLPLAPKATIGGGAVFLLAGGGAIALPGGQQGQMIQNGLLLLFLASILTQASALPTGSVNPGTLPQSQRIFQPAEAPTPQPTHDVENLAPRQAETSSSSANGKSVKQQDAMDAQNPANTPVSKDNHFARRFEQAMDILINSNPAKSSFPTQEKGLSNLPEKAFQEAVKEAETFLKSVLENAGLPMKSDEESFSLGHLAFLFQALSFEEAVLLETRGGKEKFLDENGETSSLAEDGQLPEKEARSSQPNEKAMLALSSETGDQIPSSPESLHENPSEEAPASAKEKGAPVSQTLTQQKLENALLNFSSFKEKFEKLLLEQEKSVNSPEESNLLHEMKSSLQDLEKIVNTLKQARNLTPLQMKEQLPALAIELQTTFANFLKNWLLPLETSLIHGMIQQGSFAFVPMNPQNFLEMSLSTFLAMAKAQLENPHFSNSNASNQNNMLFNLKGDASVLQNMPRNTNQDSPPLSFLVPYNAKEQDNRITRSKRKKGDPNEPDTEDEEQDGSFSDERWE